MRGLHGRPDKLLQHIAYDLVGHYAFREWESEGRCDNHLKIMEISCKEQRNRNCFPVLVGVEHKVTVKLTVVERLRLDIRKIFLMVRIVKDCS